MNVLVGYESRGGRTKKIAEAIADAARASGSQVRTAPLKEISGAEVTAADAVFVGSWVEGFILFGVGPARGARVWLEGLPALGSKPVGIFCSYGFNPRGTLVTMRRMLEAKGADVTGQGAFRRKESLGGAADLARDVLGRDVLGRAGD